MQPHLVHVSSTSGRWQRVPATRVTAPGEGSIPRSETVSRSRISTVRGPESTVGWTRRPGTQQQPGRGSSLRL
ncbi:MAG: hypothetical protein AVDCRST_MAG49-776 [uncultured Thermomicrobiales bacterium]|uniref:Uncharacterized protein n=1 Tax=uncultured Thermomicrobiales bacterium TaxID=1645740 RepID=A0A6J4U484_9BACT|nr:MAG: hypothetical protein AVDCRST_MAG49-776 [uncultured Thermomicrobiales bacterium]